MLGKNTRAFKNLNFKQRVPNRSLTNVREITFAIINPFKTLIKFRVFQIIDLSFSGVEVDLRRKQVTSFIRAGTEFSLHFLHSIASLYSVLVLNLNI